MSSQGQGNRLPDHEVIRCRCAAGQLVILLGATKVAEFYLDEGAVNAIVEDFHSED